MNDRYFRNDDEFPPGSSDWPNELSRRKFLTIMGASIALAGAGCTRNPPEHIVPYRKQPEEIIPGKPLYFATALTLGGYARGVVVETHEGRPTKIEGNSQHPASLGATDVYMQADLLTLYDPERSRSVTHRGRISTWQEFLGELTAAAQGWAQDGGAGLRLLTRHDTSPTFLDQIDRLLLKYPAAKWHEFDPLMTNRPRALYHLDKADVIVSLGSDFLCDAAVGLKYAREFSARRRPDGNMNRLYVAESTPTITGSMADHRFAVSPNELEKFAANLPEPVARDLRTHSGRSLVVAGEYESPEVHRMARELNDALGNTGATVDYLDEEKRGRGLDELVREMRGGTVDTLIMIGGNPAYDAPVDYEFSQALTKIPRTVHIGLYPNETAAMSLWHIAEAHPLETWSDARAMDGTVSIVQPMIEPLFGGRSRHELLNALLQQPPLTSYDIVHGFWQAQHSEADFESMWRRALHDGVAPFRIGGASSSSTASSATTDRKPKAENSLQLLIRPSPRLHDGSYANNAWLQELPETFTKIVWDNAAIVSPATAKRLEIENGDIVRLKFRGRSIEAPVWTLPGQVDDCVTVHLGYGRTRSGSVGNHVGFNAYGLRTSDARWGGGGLVLEKTGKHHDLVGVQHHFEMEGRELVRVGTLADTHASPNDSSKSSEGAPGPDDTLYPNVDYRTGHKWGMAIDLNTCIGCGTCTIACQAENNIPVVGREQVAMNREMHWIRIDGYFDGEARMLHQPRPCMHCETAPCELVCPVAATVHSSEGLNQMVYNRCIGTRYCSNNCPYKVRRFNFLEYDANQFEQPPTRKLMRNPNVSVRSRGVMEKCTYCIQRINAVKIDAQKANRAIQDGEIIPACAQACPADAIVFGDLNDPNSRVTKLHGSPLSYGMLAELNTRPRTKYLAKLRNPN
ncbi:MAG TPA: 4Fe-4S dicluster domain-containing protein, partial [Chthoniobacterales bacterium]|nr:4Fe-4S dicluster domain-containing protein [Chthoniobacterales bacterium]